MEDKIWSGQIRSVFLDAKRPVSFPLEDKHVVNEYHVVQKSHDAMQKKKWYISWLVWNKIEPSKMLLGRRQKCSWVSRSTGKSNSLLFPSWSRHQYTPRTRLVRGLYCQYMEKWLKKPFFLISFEVQLNVFISVRHVFAGHPSAMFKMARCLYYLGCLLSSFPFDQRNFSSTRGPFWNNDSVNIEVPKFYSILKVLEKHITIQRHVKQWLSTHTAFQLKEVNLNAPHTKRILNL